MKADDVVLSYDEDARSVHTLLRIIDPADHARTNEVLVDNLATVIALIAHYKLPVRQETIIAQEMKDLSGPGADYTVNAPGTPIDGVTGKEILLGWRQHASGSMSETLLIECYGDPALIDQINA